MGRVQQSGLDAIALMTRFPQFDREEVRMKFKLHDIRESKVWQEAHHVGVEEG